MDFELTDRERMLKESVNRLLADRYSFTQRNAYAAEPDGWSRSIWADFAELGLLGLPFSEEQGGFGGSPAELMVVLESFGRNLVLEPFVSTVLLGGGLLQYGGSAEQCETYLPGVIGGELLLAFAHDEPTARYDLSSVTVTAKKEADGWVLNGLKTRVLHGASADKLIVSARIGGNRRDTDGIALFIVDAKSAGISQSAYKTHDGFAASDVQFSDVRTQEVLGEAGQAYPLIERVIGNVMAVSSIETVGAMSAVFDLTRDYLKTRQQFGTVIGKFQALQHRLADMMIELELARSMALLAGTMIEEENVLERQRVLAQAKVQIGESARFVAQQGIQLHGGIGMTTEFAVGAYFKRITYLNQQFGDADHYLSRLAREDGRNHAA